MELVLSRFEYFFSAQGRRGGLFSTNWYFRPAPGADADRDKTRAGMEAAIDFHVDMLDRVFKRVVSGKWEVSLTDSPTGRTVGYSYRGKLTPWGALMTRRRLRAMFGPEIADADRGPVWTYSLEASVERRQAKAESRGGSIELHVRHELGHAVNVCLYRHLRAEGRFALSAEAESDTRALEELLRELGTGTGPLVARLPSCA